MPYCLLVATVLSMLAGCAAGEPTYPRGSHVLGSIAREALPGSAAVADEATLARWRADASRLAVDIERAVKRSNWGLLELTLGSPKDPPHQRPIRAEALLTDNRVAVIHGWALSENEVAASVMVGRFGDPDVQAWFLQVLADTLADKPKPKRGGTFTLP